MVRGMPRLEKPPSPTCSECKGNMTLERVRHPYKYDLGEPVLLMAISQLRCEQYPEIHSVVEIPKIEQLHRILERELVVHGDRTKIAFAFRAAPKGALTDGAWSLVLRSAV